MILKLLPTLLGPVGGNLPHLIESRLALLGSQKSNGPDFSLESSVDGNDVLLNTLVSNENSSSLHTRLLPSWSTNHIPSIGS